MDRKRLERNKNACYESSKYQGLSQHWGLAKCMMVLACTFISVKMVVLNDLYAIPFTGAVMKGIIYHTIL
ncbi:hypothetical protein [Bartonella harrusi]|uniref:Uncharacterized protein n=1 Tax=Bartonella harrusi TaxID=2961895 RepID=A0ABY5ESJ1_9HYPH|nr:hypothetical protein [Bartonella harrusi]UTO28242.1 hypothetical protein NMK50_08855 [Bartonella harrusi]